MPDSTHDDSRKELWRLHRRRELLVCVVMPGTVYQLQIIRNGEQISAEEHQTFRSAANQADLLRTQYLAEGWTGTGDR